MSRQPSAYRELVLRLGSPPILSFAVALQEVLAAHGRVNIPGLGLFELRTRKGRFITVPTTGKQWTRGEAVQLRWVPATVSVHFRPCRTWRQKLNQEKACPPTP